MSKLFRIRPLEDSMRTQTVRFIDSWTLDDVYDRFGTAGLDGRKWLKAELTQRGRSSLVAVYDGTVVGLLDYIYADGAIHIGMVVDRRFRRRSIGRHLIFALLHLKASGHAISAECQIDNRSAIALMRRCEFDLVRVEHPEMIWRAA